MKITSFLIILLVLGMVLLSGCGLEEEKEREVTKSPEDLLPTALDLSSDWVLEDGGDVDIKNQAEGKAVIIKKIDGSIILTTVLRFDSVESASSYYNGIVSQLKQKRDFEELNISGFKSRCHAFKYSFRSTERNKAQLLCKNQEFFISLDGPNNLTDLKYIVNIIDEKT